MQSDKLTIKTQEAINRAQSVARERGHNFIESTHLLDALLEQEEGSTVPVLQKLGLSVPRLREAVGHALDTLPKVSGGSPVQLGQSAAQVLESAFAEAEQLKDEYISTEHVLLAMVASERDPAGQTQTGSVHCHCVITEQLRGMQLQEAFVTAADGKRTASGTGRLNSSRTT